MWKDFKSAGTKRKIPLLHQLKWLYDMLYFWCNISVIKPVRVRYFSPAVSFCNECYNKKFCSSITWQLSSDPKLFYHCLVPLVIGLWMVFLFKIIFLNGLVNKLKSMSVLICNYLIGSKTGVLYNILTTYMCLFAINLPAPVLAYFKKRDFFLLRGFELYSSIIWHDIVLVPCIVQSCFLPLFLFFF